MSKIDFTAAREILLSGKPYTFEFSGTHNEAQLFVRRYILINAEPFALIGHLNGTFTAKLLT
jgi:hypothetical protein